MSNDLEGGPCTYDEVMLDWAVSELFSARWSAIFSRPGSVRARAKIEAGGIDALSDRERRALIGLIQIFRAPIIRAYGPAPSWRCARVTLPRAELESFAILHWFGYPTFSFLDHMKRVRDDPQSDPGMAARVRAIMDARQTGVAPRGRLIATLPRALGRPVLVDGYHRGMAALRLDDPAVEAFLCVEEIGKVRERQFERAPLL